jgi:two-component system response regulator HydG
VNVCFLTQNSGLGEAIGRALGDDFRTRLTTELDFGRLKEFGDWWEAILIDLRMSDLDVRLKLIGEISSACPYTPVVALCGEEQRAVQVRAMEHGAHDTITNPPNVVELRLILKRAHKYFSAQRELGRLRTSVQESPKLHDLHANTPEMLALFRLAEKIAPCDVNVLITGETGTGKELLARAIHQSSNRADKPLVAFSCSNLPETLIEDELFGHEKGAFTGAHTMRRGRVEAADRGTLFLDEIGDMSIALQPKLLRVLQERRFERLGANTSISVDIRLICATNRNLTEMIQLDQFREDLYYRMNVVQLHLPPLRERREDIALLAHVFLTAAAGQFNKRTKRFSPQALQALTEHSWPGNVRELENTVQRAVVLCDGHTIDLSDLPASFRKQAHTSSEESSYEDEVRQFKRRLIVRTLQSHNWKKSESARALGIARGYLHRLINQLEIREDEGQNRETNPRLVAPAPQTLM